MEFFPFLVLGTSNEDHAEKKQSQKYYLNIGKKAFCIAELQGYDENTLAHNHSIPSNHENTI